MKTDRRTLVLLHLSVLWGCIFPFGSIWGPIVCGRQRKHREEREEADIQRTKANIVNFQILWCAMVLLTLIIFWLQQIGTLSAQGVINVWPFRYIVIVFLTVNVAYPILASLMVWKSRNVRLFYPALIKFIGVR